MKIPKQIQIAGRTIKILYQDDYLADKDALGEANYDRSEINIATKYQGRKRTEENMKITFLHEIIHWILAINQEEVKNKEDFVCRTSELLFQVIKQLERE